MTKYKILQVRQELTRSHGFMSLNLMDSLGVEINLDNYNLAYEGEIDDSVNSFLEELFKIFNIEQPDDFSGRSMSVSDIVQLDSGYYYCDSFGWEKIEPVGCLHEL